VALREALTNAVVHADYSQTGSPIRVSLFSDRIEIENPGSLLQGLTIPEIQQGVSKLRNRVIGRVFSELGLIEQWGSGIQRMTSSCLQAGLPGPRFEEIGTHFRATLWFKQIKNPDLDDVDSQIIKLLKAAGEMSTNELSKKVGLSVRAIRQRLRHLIQKGQIFEIAANPKDPRKVYRTY
jgi:predicted HTH transcriptional regulator